MIEKSRKILSILALIIFLALVYLIGYFSNPDKNNLTDIVQRTKARIASFSLFDKGFRTEFQPDGFFKSEIIQEESAIIDVVEKVSPSVVSIVVKTYDFDLYNGPTSSESGIGTGFIVDSKGIIVTNSHVVDNKNGEYSVVLKDGSTLDVKKVHLDEVQDIAIIEVDGKDLPTVSLGDSDSLKVGQRAIAIGNALGRFQNTVTVGVVSGIGRDISAGRGFGSQTNVYESVIQTDAALNPGNSGGPLLNSGGQVIGINVATTSGADNISFAIPVNTLKPLLATFFSEGKLVRPFIGVNYVMISKEIATLRRMPEGAYITRIYADTPASAAGLRRGDIITKIDETPLNGETTLAGILTKYKVGQTIELTVDRNTEIVKLKVTLAEAQDRL